MKQIRIAFLSFNYRICFRIIIKALSRLYDPLCLNMEEASSWRGKRNSRSDSSGRISE
jgi:hypothetical protein